MILDWFDTTKVDALADELVAEVVRRIPPESIEASGKKGESKQRRTREILLQKAGEFSAGQRLNIYKKARLANRFKWGLLDAGYQSQFVDEIAYELASVMAARKASPA